MVSAWLAGYLQGSFRDVPFYIDGHQYKSGRRLAEHTSPNVDQVEQEDMGQARRDVSLSAYIVDNDYFQQRDSLKSALEQEGPGVLVHPYLGIMNVKVNSFTLKETTKEGRVARFEITMYQDAEPATITITPNTKNDIAGAKEAAVVALNEQFVDEYIPEGVPNSGPQQAIGVLESAIEGIENVKKFAAPLAEYQRLIATIEGKITQIVLEGEDLANTILSVTDFGNDPLSIELNPPSPAEQFAEMVSLFGIGSANPLNTPDVILNQPGNPEALISEQFARISVVSAAGLISVIDFDTVDEALEAGQNIYDEIDRINSDVNTAEAVAISLRDLRRAIVGDLNKRVLDLANQVEIDILEDEPVYVSAYKLDGSLDNVDDIIQRNKIRHPGFTPGNKPLKVLYYGT